MKKTVLVVLLLVMSAVPAPGAKMVVELRSGNKVVVEYTGTIDKVSMEGTEDAIAGVHLKDGTEEYPIATTQTPEVPAVKPLAAPTVEADKKGDSKFKYRWADPKIED
ncbi:MAG: hypothetical protein K9K37_13110 [Desulfocapsa sp.]|nr:hypothetical protein [Desulfocapsa sp.]